MGLLEDCHRFGILRSMARRRSSPNPLATVNKVRWLVTRDACSRPVEYTVLSPGSDLKVALANARQRLVSEGWTADSMTRHSFVFCQKGNERFCVSVECFEPGTAPIGHGHFRPK